NALISRASTGGPMIAGLAFAVAWLPCTGPTLGAILTAASTESTVGKGGVLLAFYAAGLAVPFILSALAFTRVTAIFRFFRKHYAVITVASGVVLVAMGVALYTDQLTRVNSWLNDLGINGISNLCGVASRGGRAALVVPPCRRGRRRVVPLRAIRRWD